MSVIHIESGLGNQMLSFCEYIAFQKANPGNELFIENIIYEIPECNDTICQWNGYELERIFGIKAKNIKHLFSENEWKQIISEVTNSRFWEKRWNYPVYITKALNNHGLHLINIRGDFEKLENQKRWARGWIGDIRNCITQKTALGNYIRRKITAFRPPVECNESLQKALFYKTENEVFTGQRLTFKHCGSGIERIKEEIDKTFVFPDFQSPKNVDFANQLDCSNAVFIHARRGDMLASNGWCYKYGYFKRAVEHIKKNVNNPVFVFFTNTGSIEWCKENAKIFGLDYSKDEILFVDWNIGNESYCDMQLMTHCKHGIITNSSFGWWGAFLIKNPNKITISPLAEINTTYHC